MKKLILMLSSLVYFCLVGYSQSLPTDMNKEYCPQMTIVFSLDRSDYSIYTAKGVEGAVIHGNSLSLRFTDKKETHSVQLISTQGTYSNPTYTFTKIKTLDGIKGKLPNVSAAPVGFDYVIPYVELCNIWSSKFYSPSIYYKDDKGKDFGSPVGFTEWIIPKNWTVNGQLSDGTNIIKTATPEGNIITDKFSTGVFKVRGASTCNPTFKSSDWFNVYIDRPKIELKANGKSEETVICGDKSIKSFSLTHADKLSCINSFTWTIGLGWNLSDGNPAPSTLTTTTGRLDLVPDSYIKPDPSVSVSFTSDDKEYSFKIPIAYKIAIPEFSISSSSLILSRLCTEETYYINGLPEKATVSWTLATVYQPPSNIVISETIGNTLKLTMKRNSPVLLSASITTPCYNTSTKQELINVGPLVNGTVKFDEGRPFNPYYICPDQTGLRGIIEYFDILGKSPTLLKQYTYEVVPGSGYKFIKYANSDYGAYNASLSTSKSEFTVPVKVNNGCGFSEPFILKIIRSAKNPRGCAAPRSFELPNSFDLLKIYTDSADNSSTIRNDHNFMVYPNPASKDLNVNLPPLNYNAKDYLNFTCYILDLNGKIIRTFKPQVKKQKITIDVQNVRNGIYFLRVIGIENSFTEKIIVYH